MPHLQINQASYLIRKVSVLYVFVQLYLGYILDTHEKLFLMPPVRTDVLQGPVVQSPISTNPGLTLNKTYGVNLGLAPIRL